MYRSIFVLPLVALALICSMNVNAQSVVITEISPNFGPTAGGTSVTITGSGFQNPIAVDFDGETASAIILVNSSTITCTTPPKAAGLATVTVNSNSNFAFLSGGFSFTDNAAPIVSSVSPNVGPTTGGTFVTVNGSNFIDGASVEFDGIFASGVNYVSATQLTCLSPPHGVGSVPVRVTNPDLQRATLNAAFTYQSSQTADLSLSKTVSAPVARVGDTVTFTITVSNAGPNPANNIVVKDILPPSVSYEGDDGSESYDPGTGFWSISSLNANASITINILADLLTSGTVTNVAEIVSSDANDPDSTPNNNVLAEDDQDEVSLLVLETGFYLLTVNNGSGSGIYPIADIVPIAATPQPGKIFAQWTGDLAPLANPNTPFTTVSMPSQIQIEVTATFMDGPGTDPDRPIAAFTISPDAGLVGFTASFDGSASTPGSRIIQYVWDFGDGSTAVTTSPTTTHTYLNTGVFLATLSVVRDDFLFSALATNAVLVVSTEVGDAFIFIKSVSYKLNFGVPNRDSIKISGFVNLIGFPLEISQLQGVLSINDVPIEGAVKFKTDGSFTFDASGLDLVSILGIPNKTGTFNITSEIGIQISDGQRLQRDSNNVVQSSAKVKQDGKGGGTGSMIPRPGLSSPGGAINAPRFAAVEQTGAAHSFNANGNIKSPLNDPLIPIGPVTIMIGDGGALISIPADRFAVTGSGIKTKIKFLKTPNLPEIKKFQIDTGKASYRLQTTPITDTGIPLADSDAPAIHNLELIFAVPLDKGIFTFETMLEMRRRRSTDTKWTNRK